MRIALLSCFYPYRGGISQFNSFLNDELSKKHTVKAFNFKRQYPNFLFPGKTQFVEEIDAASIKATPLLDTANPFSYISSSKEIRNWKPDLLIMRYWLSYLAPSQGWVARHVGKECKVISILDNVVPHEPKCYDKLLTSYFLKGNDAFVVLCDAVKNDLLSLNPNAKFTVSNHPIYSNYGKAVPREIAADHLRIDPKLKTILFFGLIRDYKGLDILLDSFSQLDESYQLIIAGEPYGSFDKYQKKIDSSPNKNNIKLFTKYIPDQDIPYYFCAADVCVLPYRSATQSGISSVSYYYETPLITTAVGGLKETIADAGTGIVIDEVSSDKLTSAIETYFQSSTIKEELINGIKKEKSRLSWDNFCNNLLELYNNL